MAIHLLYHIFIMVIMLVIFTRYTNKKISLLKSRVSTLEKTLNEAIEVIQINKLSIEQNKTTIEEQIKTKES